MKKLEFKTKIRASAQEVWNTMVGKDTYKKWTKVSWPGSDFEGEWRQGEKIKFLGDGQGGTQALIEEFRPYELIQARHIAIVQADGSLDNTSDAAKGWIDTTETYRFAEQDGVTELKVEMVTNPAWEKMFSDGWPNALEELKRLTEKQVLTH